MYETSYGSNTYSTTNNKINYNNNYKQQSLHNESNYSKIHNSNNNIDIHPNYSNFFHNKSNKEDTNLYSSQTNKSSHTTPIKQNFLQSILIILDS